MNATRSMFWPRSSPTGSVAAMLSRSATMRPRTDHAEQLRELPPGVAQIEILKRRRATGEVEKVELLTASATSHHSRTWPRRDGVVFEAVQESLGRPVAPRSGDARSARRETPARFVREAAGRGEAPPHEHRPGFRSRRTRRHSLLRHATDSWGRGSRHRRSVAAHPRPGRGQQRSTVEFAMAQTRPDRPEVTTPD